MIFAMALAWSFANYAQAQSLSAGIINVEQFQSLRGEMTEDEVVAIAGRPGRVFAEGCSPSALPGCQKRWYYSYVDQDGNKREIELSFLFGRLFNITTRLTVEGEYLGQ